MSAPESLASLSVHTGVQCNYLQSVQSHSRTVTMDLSVREHKKHIDCWSAMDKIVTHCASRVLRGTKSTPGFCSQNIEVRLMPVLLCQGGGASEEIITTSTDQHTSKLGPSSSALIAITRANPKMKYQRS